MLSERLIHALQFAVNAHGRQTRKGSNVPYVVHPIGVATILIQLDCHEDVVIAGLLHDTVEDAGVQLQTIAGEFGPRVAELVQAASEPDKSDTWENRKRHTIAFLQTCSDMDVLMLSCADKLDNLRSIRADLARLGDALWNRFNAPREKQRWYYQSLARVFLSKATGEPGRSLFSEFHREVEAVFGQHA